MEVKAELTPLPRRIKNLPIDPKRKIPVPWFVAWVNGEPEFRAADGMKWGIAVRMKLCWVCGEKLGANYAFVIGPMCGITRTTSEPPCHRECAEWSLRNCPFLTRPAMERRTAGLPDGVVDAPGIPLERNPGVGLLWVTRDYKLFKDHNGRRLIKVGQPIETEFYANGRAATRAEIEESVRTGVPHLEALAKQEGPQACVELASFVADFLQYLPAGFQV